MKQIGSPFPWVIAYGNWLFKTRNTVFPLVMLALFAGFSPVLAGGTLAADHWLDLAGLLVALSGQALRAAVIGYAYIKRGGLNKQVHADKLVTEGFFAHARNPLYDGNLLILAGLFMVHNNPLVYLLGGVFFVTAYIAIIAAEETFLAEKFGAEYEDYCARVNRWLPRLGGLRATMQGMAFNWRRVILKDYASAYTWMMAVLLLLTYESYCAGEAGSDWLPLLIAAMALTGSFLLARWLKKSRILTENGNPPAEPPPTDTSAAE